MAPPDDFRDGDGSPYDTNQLLEELHQRVKVLEHASGAAFVETPPGSGLYKIGS